HRQAKIMVRDFLRRRGLTAEIEWIVDCLPGDRRADVMVWSARGNMFAIEIQQSSISIDDIEARTKSYFRAGIRVLWLVLVDNKRLEDAEALADGKRRRIERYPASHWERWIHGFNYGHIWLLNVDGWHLLKGNLEEHELYVESSSWFADGEEHSAGGYFRSSKRFRELTIEEPLKLDNALIDTFHRKQHLIWKYFYPEGKAATFVPRSPLQGDVAPGRDCSTSTS
ncbi:MAG: competence protein CoiA family protein, partial [Acidobacteriota bacterium]